MLVLNYFLNHFSLAFFEKICKYFVKIAFLRKKNDKLCQYCHGPNYQQLTNSNGNFPEFKTNSVNLVYVASKYLWFTILFSFRQQRNSWQKCENVERASLNCVDNRRSTKSCLLRWNLGFNRQPRNWQNFWKLRSKVRVGFTFSYNLWLVISAAAVRVKSFCHKNSQFFYNYPDYLQLFDEVQALQQKNLAILT